jgi:hypothetical protein
MNMTIDGKALLPVVFTLPLSLTNRASIQIAMNTKIFCQREQSTLAQTVPLIEAAIKRTVNMNHMSTWWDSPRSSGSTKYLIVLMSKIPSTFAP